MSTSRPSVDTENGRVRILSKEEGRRLFDEEARRTLGISGDEFIRRYDAGEFDDPDDSPEVMNLVSLLPFAQ